MDAIINLITPGAIIDIIVFAFGLWITRANLNSRVRKLEEQMDRVDIAKIEVTLREIQTDLKWIMKEMSLEK